MGSLKPFILRKAQAAAQEETLIFERERLECILWFPPSRSRRFSALSRAICLEIRSSASAQRSFVSRRSRRRSSRASLWTTGPSRRGRRGTKEEEVEREKGRERFCSQVLTLSCSLSRRTPTASATVRLQTWRIRLRVSFLVSFLVSSASGIMICRLRAVGPILGCRLAACRLPLLSFFGSCLLDGLDEVVPARTAFWGTLVRGVDDGEGWLRLGPRHLARHRDTCLTLLRVGAYFLPMALSGVQVLTPEAPFGEKTGASPVLWPLSPCSHISHSHSFFRGLGAESSAAAAARLCQRRLGVLSLPIHLADFAETCFRSHSLIHSPLPFLLPFLLLPLSRFSALLSSLLLQRGEQGEARPAAPHTAGTSASTPRVRAPSSSPREHPPSPTPGRQVHSWCTRQDLGARCWH